MLWTALGLLVATIVSIEEALTSEKPHRIKTLVVLLAIAGLAVGTVSAISENKDKESAQKTVKELTDKLDSQKPLLDLINTGLRPEDCFRLRWEAITWANGRHGTLLVTHGKTAAARRVLPMTPRVRGIVETRWEKAGKPVEGWVWPAPTRSGHIESSSLKKQHAKAFGTLRQEAAKNDQKAMRPFVLYSLRHTFLTRLGESGCDAWTLARIAGHSNVSMSSRYVHPSEDAVLAAMANLGGHKIGHNSNRTESGDAAQRQLTQ